MKIAFISKRELYKGNLESTYNMFFSEKLYSEGDLSKGLPQGMVDGGSGTNIDNLAYRAVVILAQQTKPISKLQIILRGDITDEDKRIKSRFESFCRTRNIKLEYWEFPENSKEKK